jgi:hypothetical protein
MNRDMSDDITVFLSGEFRLTAPLELGPGDSATNGYNIVYTAAPGAHPVLSGAVRVTGWSLVDPAKKLWSAAVPPGLNDLHRLSVNGTPASRTRGRLLPVFSSSARDSAVPAAAAGANWRNSSDVVFEPPGPDAVWSERRPKAPLFVANAFELLGKPGEWYFDRTARRICYTPRAGEDLATADVEAGVVPGLITGRGAPGRPLSGIIFKGLRLEFTDRARPAPGSPEPCAVDMGAASDLQFVEDVFVHMGGSALGLHDGVEGATVDGCVFGDLAKSAVELDDASRIRISGCRVSFVANENPHLPAIRASRSHGVRIEHSQIDHYPSVALMTDGDVQQESNLILDPLIRYHGKEARARSSEGGLPDDYRSLLDLKVVAFQAPESPGDVSALAGDSHALVTWTPPTRDGGSPVAGYTVTASTGATLSVGADAFLDRGYADFPDLERGHPVTFTVEAANAFGTSPPSLPSSPVTPARRRNLKLPGAPTAASVRIGADGATLSIVPSGDDGGSPVLSYVVNRPKALAPLVLEGLDVVHSDSAHPFRREHMTAETLGPAPLSVQAVNSAGPSDAAVVTFSKP